MATANGQAFECGGRREEAKGRTRRCRHTAVAGRTCIATVHTLGGIAARCRGGMRTADWGCGATMTSTAPGRLLPPPVPILVIGPMYLAYYIYISSLRPIPSHLMDGCAEIRRVAVVDLGKSGVCGDRSERMSPLSLRPLARALCPPRRPCRRCSWQSSHRHQQQRQSRALRGRGATRPPATSRSSRPHRRTPTPRRRRTGQAGQRLTASPPPGLVAWWHQASDRPASRAQQPQPRAPRRAA